MSKTIENVSSDLFDFLKSRFELGPSVDEKGKSTNDPANMKVFTFDFIDNAGEDCGCVSISLLDDSESNNSLKIYFGQELSDANSEVQKEWSKFLLELRQFSKMHMLGFDIRNINKSTLTKRDLDPMFESTFGPIDGTVRTSKQPLENMQIIIKHTANVDPKIKNSRSRKIQKIYLANAKGEKFLLPFTSLMAARAMARHIFSGGTPYDPIGSDICNLVEEMTSLCKFVRHMKNVNFENPESINAINASKERYAEIKRQLNSLSSQGGYEKNKTLLTGHAGEIEEDDDYPDLFGKETLSDENKLALPHVMKAYKNKGKLAEEGEFEKWVAASAGHGEGDEILNDDELTESFLTFNDAYKACLTHYQEELHDLIKGRASRKLIKDKRQQINDLKQKITEGDVPSATGTGSPLTRPDLTPMNHFHSPKEINKIKNLSGKASPLSLLSGPEKPRDNPELDDIVRLSGAKK